MAQISHDEFHPELVKTLSHKTPFFLFSKKRMQDEVRQFNQYFPEASIHYAMKANSEPEVLQTLSDTGCGFEVASSYELNMLQEIKVAPEKILYGTSVKPASHIKEFFDYGVDRFAVDSFPELEKIAMTAPGSKVYVRVQVDDTGSVFKFSEKFGTEKENIVPLFLKARGLGLHPYGISFHVGSQANNLMAWANALKTLHEPLLQLRKLGIEIDMLNLGGGYPCKYISSEHDFDLKEIADSVLTQYKKLPYQPKLILEPGRRIIANTGILVTSIIARVERKENTWLFLDAGVYSALFETMAYQGSTRYKVTSMRPAHDPAGALFALAGPTGDSPDVITREALLPKDISVDEKLIFHTVGAYNLVTSNRFNGFPKPDVYFI